jgi:hypothetical protein
MTSKTYTMNGQSTISAAYAVQDAKGNLHNRLLSDGYQQQGESRVTKQWVQEPDPDAFVAEDRRRWWHATITAKATR